MEHNEALINAGKRFDNLVMPNPPVGLDHEGNEVKITHPFDVLMATFYDFEKFSSYFWELEKTYNGPVSFEDYLQNLYNDLCDAALIMANMKSGAKPKKLGKVTKSYEILRNMISQVLSTNNVRLAKFIQ